jgi:LCP family protein required for cell wall assembly
MLLSSNTKSPNGDSFFGEEGIFMSSQVPEHITKKENNRKRIGIMIIVLLILSAAVAFCFNVTRPTAATVDSVVNQPQQAMSLPPTNKKINILVLGVDERQNDTGRSNVTCVVTIDPNTKSAALLWVPRDSRVKIPGNGWNKIGHAYAYGGPKLSEQTVSDLLGIPIDYYIEINMDGFKKVIDALGGVDINVDKRMYYYDPYDAGEVDNNGLIDLKPGSQHMDGNTALEYVRFRHDEMGDIGRIQRQQKFVKALLSDIATPSVITKLPNVLKEANAAFKTDIPVSEMLKLTTQINAAYKQGLKTDMVAGTPVYIDEISYWLPDISAMRKQVAQLQGVTMDNKYLVDTKNLASEYAQSTAKNKVVIAP